MIYYSIIPFDVVMGNNSSSTIKNFSEIDYLGEKVQVYPGENNKLVISRLISTSPKAFLNPKLQPGTMIE